MSIRVDSAPLISGAVVVGVPGLGVLAETVPSAGEHGPGYLYDQLTLPEDNGVEVRGLITRWPTLGTLVAFEDSSFTYDGGTDDFEFQVYRDGVASGDPVQVNLEFTSPVEILPLSGRATITGHAPLVTQGAAQTIEPIAGRISARGYAPEIQQDAGVTVTPTAGSVSARGYAPTISQPITLSPQSWRVTAAGYAPIIEQSLAVQPIAGRITVSGHAPSVTQGGAITISPATGRAQCRGYAPTIGEIVIAAVPSMRVLAVPHENRVLEVPHENRTLIVRGYK